MPQIFLAVSAEEQTEGASFLSNNISILVLCLWVIDKCSLCLQLCSSLMLGNLNWGTQSVPQLPLKCQLKQPVMKRPSDPHQTCPSESRFKEPGIWTSRLYRSRLFTISDPSLSGVQVSNQVVQQTTTCNLFLGVKFPLWPVSQTAFFFS